MKLIDKSAVVAEINRALDSYDPNEITSGRYALVSLRDFLDTLEVKEEDLDEEIEKCLKQYHMIAVGKEEFEPIAKHFFELGLKIQKSEDKFARPDTDIKDAIEVTSRLKYLDNDLRPIADFIMNYASWNLHKDEWNQPTIEVPLFRVLDALAQRGKPYCCKTQKGE